MIMCEQFRKKFRSGKILTEVNATYITLVPKNMSPTSLGGLHAKCLLQSGVQMHH